MRTRTTAFLELGHRLATAGDEPVHLARLREDLTVPASTFHAWSRQMRFQRVLTRTPEGDRVDRPNLLGFYQAHRVVRADPVLEVRTNLDARRASDLLRRHEIRHALCMLSAANEWAFFESRDRGQLYIDRRDVPRVRELLPEGDLTLQCFHENLDDLPTQPRDRRPVTSVFLTVVDCRAHPEGGAHADFVDRNVLQKRPPRARRTA